MDFKIVFEFVLAMTICDILKMFVLGIIGVVYDGIKESLYEDGEGDTKKLKCRKNIKIYGFVDRKDET